MLRKALSLLFLVLLLMASSTTALAAGNSQADDTTSKVLYFYVTPCDECAAVKGLLDRLPGVVEVQSDGKTFQSAVTVIGYNVGTEDGLKAARELFARYHVPDSEQSVPILFFRNSYLSGSKEIAAYLDEKLKNGDALGTLEPGTGSDQLALQSYEWPGIFLTGLVNGFNPCSISMLLFLITLLLARSASVMKMGLSFIAGKFVMYIVLGTALFSLLLTIDNAVFKTVQDVAKVVLLAVVVVVAAVNVSDFVAARNEKYDKVHMQLPVFLRRLNHQWMKKVTDAAGTRWLLVISFGLGLLVSIGEFLCTGQIYLATIIYMLKRSPSLSWQTLGAFLLYVLGMVLPLLALTFAVSKGREVYSLSELARRNMPLIKLANAAVFVVFGVILIINL
jgi:cytochrome c biogenesis protein CcdA